MGQYKVPQNVESEDKIIGALTLKQFIYTVVGVMIAIVSFLTLRQAPIVMLIVGLPPTALFLLLGLYQRQDQPFEALFLSIVSFTAKPRKRLWIKEPIEEVFKIEAPKVIKAVTQRDPREVRGQLEQLSQVVDTRGWGSKKAELQEPNSDLGLDNEGRLVAAAIPDVGEPIETDVSMADDILDIHNNPNLDHLIQDQTKSIREEAVARLRASTPPTSTQPAPTLAPTTTDITPVGSSNLTTDAIATAQAQTAAASPSTYLPDRQASSGNNNGSATSSPAASTPQPSPAPSIPQPGLGQASQPAGQSSAVSTTDMTVNPLDGILKLAMESDDLPVSQVAAQANRQQALAEGQSVSLRNNGNSS